MNEIKESGRITQGEYEESLCREWIPMVQTFINSWGKNMIINDLCVALNDVEETLEIPRATWPPFTLIPLLDINPLDP